MRWLVLCALLAAPACANEIDAGGADVDAGIDDDPLSVSFDPEPGSLDYIHQTVIAERCSGQPGLCHNGQFEPNLATPAATYAYLVNRPAIEKRTVLRVAPGDADASFLVDKLRNRDVSTQMPLGADPLTEDEIQMIEAWIEGGALRRPGASPAPDLNNPPLPPEMAVYDTGGIRLDSGNRVVLQVGQTVRLRHSVEDFETADDSIAFATFILGAGNGYNVVLSPGADDPQNGPTTYDAAGPMGNGDRLNYYFDWTVPATLDLVDDDTGATSSQPASGATLTPAALYVDEFPGGIVAYDITSGMTIEIE
jgi:hypothetical protein